MGSIKVDDKTFVKGIESFLVTITSGSKKAIGQVADEILRLSTFEVPHDQGLLQASGHQEPNGDGVIVGYNKVYAARLHEHPEYHFQKGRKGKYLEDPIKNNLVVFRRFIQKALSSII